MEKLSPMIRVRWAIKYVFYALIALIIAYFSSPILEEILFLEEGSLFPNIALILFLMLFPFLIYIEMVYRTFRYKLDERELIVKRGIININQTVIPYERIQNINLDIDWISNLLGIAKVKIETAGSNVDDSEVELPGIDNPKVFVKLLIDKVEKAREHSSTKKIMSNEERVLENKEKIENVEKSLENIKEMLNSLSQRLIAYESDFNQIHDKLERIENLTSNLNYRVEIIEKEQEEVEKRVDSSVSFVNDELEKIKAAIEKIKKAKEGIKKRRSKKEK